MDKRIYLLSAIAFVVGMVELVIGGILHLIAEDLGVSIARAGLLITVFALVFGPSGPILLYLTGRADRKRVALAALFVFLVGNLAAVVSTTYGAVMISRILLAASGGLLTVLCLTVAAHISRPEYRGRAIGLVIMGISGSIVLGLPIGVSLGHAYGWRSPFLLVALLTAVLIPIVAAYFGTMTTQPPLPLKAQLQALRARNVLAAHLTTFFFLAGHLTLYAYLTPFVISTVGYSGQLITLVYVIYGIAAVIGGGLAGVAADKFGAGRTVISVIVLLAICLLIFPLVAHIPGMFWICLATWGVLSWGCQPPIQTHLVQLSPETADIQQSLNTAVLHLGIALGTLVGGAVIHHASVAHNAWVGAGVILISLVTVAISLHGTHARRLG